jgi:hypothetical protein
MIALLWLTMMERAVHALFVVSLAALGVSPTLVAIPLLFSGFLYPLVLHKRWPHSQRFLTTTTLVAAVAILWTLVPHSTLTVLASAIAVLALTVLLFDAIARLGRDMLLPSVLAVLLAITLRTLNHTAALGLTDRGVVLLILVVIAVVALRVFPRREHVPAPLSFRGADAVVAFLLVEYQLFGQPAALATLHDAPAIDPAWWYFAFLVSCQAGLLIGLQFARTLGAALPVRIAALSYLVGAVLLGSGIAYIAAPLWIIVTQAAAVLLLGAALNGPLHSVADEGKRTGLVQVVWWLLIVLHAFAGKWPFLPSVLRPILQDRATIYLLLSFTVLPIALLFEDRRRTE